MQTNPNGPATDAAQKSSIVSITGLMTRGSLPPTKRSDLCSGPTYHVTTYRGLREVMNQHRSIGVWRFNVESQIPRFRNGIYDEDTATNIIAQVNWPLPLFPSYSALVNLMHENLVTSLELSEGLFAFGCTRDHAMTLGKDSDRPRNEIWYRYKTHEQAEAKELHDRVVLCIETAEKEKRLMWNKSGVPPHNRVRTQADYIDLLFAANGLPRLYRGEMYQGASSMAEWEGNLYDLDQRIASTKGLHNLVTFWCNAPEVVHRQAKQNQPLYGNQETAGSPAD